MDTKCIDVLLIEDIPDGANLISGYLGETTTFQFNLHVTDRLSSGLTHLINKHLDSILLDSGLPYGQG